MSSVDEQENLSVSSAASSASDRGSCPSPQTPKSDPNLTENSHSSPVDRQGKSPPNLEENNQRSSTPSGEKDEYPPDDDVNNLSHASSNAVLVIPDDPKSDTEEERVEVSDESSEKLSKCVLATCLIGAFLLLLGIIMIAGAFQAIFNAILQAKMEVTEGSMVYDIWKNTPVPITMSIYLYNLTNPDEFSKGDKPILQEVGPFVYQEFHNKTGLDFHDNRTVSYYQRRWWVWDQEASGNNREDDLISLMNPVPVSAAYSVSSPIGLWGLNQVMNLIGEQLTIVKPVREIIFDGFEDPLLDLVQNASHSNLSHLLDMIDLPDGLLDYDKMGWFYNRNMSDEYDGHFNMFTGEDSLDNIGSIDWWNGEQETDFYGYPCNRVFGSAGDLWPPGQTATSISLYSSDLCMTLTMPYKEEIIDSNGISGYRYWADNRTFASPEVVPENFCHCTDNSSCPVSGLLDAETCRMGAPAYISFPHFLFADESLFDGFANVSRPVEERDQFILDMIPELGVPLQVKARMQINMQVTRYRKVDLLSKVHDVMLPLLWFEVTASLSEEMAHQLKPVLFFMRSPFFVVLWSLFILVGLAMLITAALWRQKH